MSSGTAALVFCLLNLRARYPHISQPAVIIPGYCCPDLLSAAQGAGYTPVVVDIGATDPGYELQALEAAMGPNTLAVIAVNFLGVAERLLALRTLMSGFPEVALIEDNAQWFPPSAEPELVGEYHVFSFGRGKAIGLLGGGLVAVRRDVPIKVGRLPASASMGRAWPVKAWLVNQLARPQAFYWLNRLSFLRLGETHYRAFQGIQGIPTRIRHAFDVNHQHYLSLNGRAEIHYDAVFEALGWNRFEPLTGPRRGRLLRYPVLCKSPSHRERLLEMLTKAGLGASALYKTELARVNGVGSVPGIVFHGNLPNAAHFAARLLTLPTHEHVSTRALEQISDVLNAHPE
ncbi:MAG: DegT/DnrJ/EryC1/StrS family aminotransferase [Natronospirillum sp.]